MSLRSFHRFGLLALTLLTLSQCKKKDPSPELPPETTTGAMTFGCKIDGRVFVPRDYYTRTGLYVQYVNLGSGKGGGYFLNIPATDWASKEIDAVRITTDSLLVQEGKTYSFRTSKGNPHAEYDSGPIYKKLDQDDGQLTITRFDPAQGILSGRFNFVGTNKATGQQVHVTDGRFDVRF
jgi:hypothetical protein